MSRPDDRSVDLRRALASHGLHVARHVVTWLPARGTPRDVAFRRYFAAVGDRFRREPTRFRVERVRPVAAGPGHRILELTLTGPAAARPGDMVALTWHNATERVVEAVAAASTPVRFWTTPRPCRPARPARADAATFYREVVDLGLPLPAGDHARTAPRIVPRIYTLAGIEPVAAVPGHGIRNGAAPGAGSAARDPGVADTRITILVSHRAAWPDRAAAYLCRLRHGDEVGGWLLPHPSRLPALHGALGRGLAVVTGSGVAGVLAGLRTHTLPAPIRLVWGTRHEIEPWLREELAAHVAAGTIDRLDLLRSRGPDPHRVTDALDPADLRDRVDHGGWVYVSGHAATGAPVRDRFVAAVGGATVDRMVDELRYIEST